MVNGQTTPASMLSWVPVPLDKAGWLHLRAAAAVLAQFDLEALVPIGGPATDEGVAADARRRLRRDAEPVAYTAAGRPVLSLREGPRREALRKLGTCAAMRAALACNQMPDTPLQRVFVSLISEQPLALESLSRDELAAALVAVRWLRGILDGLPAHGEIEQALASRELFERIDRLAGRDFVGREEEINRLDAHLHTPSPEPLLVHGPGGIGKSTLVAHFLRERMRMLPSMPVVWLDMDRGTLDPERPQTLLSETAHQLAVQLPQVRARFAALRTSTAHDRSGLESVELSKEADVFTSVVHDFKQALQDAPLNTPIVLVLDTFEEVQFRGNEVESNTAAFLRLMQDAGPGFRVILCGRAAPQTPKIWSFALDELRPWEAEQLLHRLLAHAAPAGGAAELPAEAIRELAATIGGNPLSVWLASRVVQAEGLDALTTSERRAEVVAAVRAEKLQSMLYGRILSHLRSENARKVALPGLIVRVITRGVIAEVLARPCGLDLSASGSDYQVFDELSHEVALVEYDPAHDWLRHRSDVRRLMLSDLITYVPEATARAIDEAAVTYWQAFNDPAERAEELYHRLRLGQGQELLEPRWIPSAAPYLKDALQEVPPAQRLWLAEKLGISVDPEVRQAATLEAWEQQAQRVARRYLRAGEIERALATLRERSERSSRSPLFLIEAEALRISGRHAEAREAAARGAGRAASAGDFALAVELRLFVALVDEEKGWLAEALAQAEAAGRLSDSVADPVLRLRTLVTRIRLLRKLGPERDAERRQLQTVATALAMPDLLYGLTSRPALLREIVAELGPQDAEILKSGIATVGLETRTVDEGRELGKALETLNRSQTDAAAGTVPGEVSSWLGIDPKDPKAYETWVVQHGGAELTGRVSEWLSGSPIEHSVRKAFTQYFRTLVESGIHQTWPAASWARRSKR